VETSHWKTPGKREPDSALTSNSLKPVISLIPYLNALPLTHFLKTKNPTYSVTTDVPSESCNKLAAGRVDAGLVSSISLPEIPDVCAVDGVCIASEGPVESVFLFSKKSPDQIHSIGLDPASRTSNVLIQILMSRWVKTKCRFLPFQGELAEGMRKMDGVLAIGDRAFLSAIENPAIIAMDLASEWKKFTGFPFVFAMWGLRRTSSLSPDIFRKAMESGMEKRIEIADQFSRENQFTKRQQQLTRRYLTHNLHYTFGPRERKGLLLFFSYATEMGLIHPSHELNFI